MTTRELLDLIAELHQPQPEHDAHQWDSLLADVDQGRSHE